MFKKELKTKFKTTSKMASKRLLWFPLIASFNVVIDFIWRKNIKIWWYYDKKSQRFWQIRGNTRITLSPDLDHLKNTHIHDIYIKDNLYTKIWGQSMTIACCVGILKMSMTTGDNSIERSLTIEVADWSSQCDWCDRSFSNTSLFRLSTAATMIHNRTTSTSDRNLDIQICW